MAAPRGTLSRGRLLTAIAFLAVTPVLVALADSDASITAYAQLTGSMLLFQGAIIVAAMLPANSWREREVRSRNPAAPAVAVMAGAALLITLALPVGAWFAGLAMFICLMFDAIAGRMSRWGWIPFALGAAFVVCWVAGGADAWNALLWWLFPLALLGGLALNFAAPRAPSDSILGSGRRSAGIAIACLGILCSLAALVLAWRAPAQAVFIAIEGAFALLLTPRTGRRFGRQGIFGLMAAVCLLTGAVFVSAIG